jgi:hypothetical protein
MLTTDQFKPMLSTVLASQDAEVILGRQSAVAEYGREVRAALSVLPPEVSHGLLAEYRKPSPQLLNQIGETILLRETANDQAKKQTLDQEWLSGDGTGRKMLDNGVGDPWNSSGH